MNERPQGAIPPPHGGNRTKGESRRRQAEKPLPYGAPEKSTA
jgi:hypothetical protein